MTRAATRSRRPPAPVDDRAPVNDLAAVADPAAPAPLSVVAEPDDLDRAAALLSQARSVIVLAHVQPDADALGSALALGLALRRTGTPVWVAFAEPAEIPESLRFLPGAELVYPAAGLPARADLVVTVDVNAAVRLGSLAELVDQAPRSLVIDHHLSNTRFGTDHLLDPAAESTTVLVAALLDRLELPIDEQIAVNLYAGLATDSVGFRHASAGAHRLAARLVEAGVRPDELVHRISDDHPPGWLAMLSTVLARATQVGVGAAGPLVWTWVTRRDSRTLRNEERDSVIDIIATTAPVAAVFKETSANCWQVSLRSRPEIDVAAVAVELGGGGHRRAAGFGFTGSPRQGAAVLASVLTRRSPVAAAESAG